jgi:hypothetical protein
MRVTQLRQADLNLLVVFSVLAEERNVSRAAKRLLLSQPAVSRALQRMRDTFHDDLLVRTAKGYEPTPPGEREQVGETVGYQVRFEEVSGPRTRLRFVMEGILTRRLFRIPASKASMQLSSTSDI